MKPLPGSLRAADSACILCGAEAGGSNKSETQMTPASSDGGVIIFTAGKPDSWGPKDRISLYHTGDLQPSDRFEPL